MKYIKFFENFSINENNEKNAADFWRVLGQRLSDNNGYKVQWVADDRMKEEKLEKDVKASTANQKLAIISVVRAGDHIAYQVTTHKDNVEDVMKIANSLLASSLPEGYKVSRQGEWFVEIQPS